MARSRGKTNEKPSKEATGKKTAKPDAPSGGGRIASFVALVIVGTLIVGGYFGFTWLQQKIDADPSYQLSRDGIHVNEPPDWISGNVRDEVAAVALRKNTHIQQPDLTVNLAQAFAMHPWVKSVVRVSKHYPAGVDVELVYRRPIAMVEVDSPTIGKGLLPIDEDAVLLPTQGFDQQRAARFPRIYIPETAPRGGEGSPWGDARAVGAARLVRVLEPHWQTLSLYRIIAQRANRDPDSAILYGIETNDDIFIRWGTLPVTPAGKPLGINVKLSLLKERLAKVRKSSGTAQGSVIDIAEMFDGGSTAERPTPERR